MLVLSRRAGEKIVIGNKIFVEVISTSEGGVRLGITAPKETSIHRYEVFSEIEEANKAAEIAISEIGQAALKALSPHFRAK